MAEHVNHPKHYNGREDGVECIEIVRHYTFDIGCAIKYLWRAGLKAEMGMPNIEKEIEDLKKAQWYIMDYLHSGHKDEMEKFVDDDLYLATGRCVKELVAPYGKHVARAIRNLLYVGIIHDSIVVSIFDWRERLGEAVVAVLERIKELEEIQRKRLEEQEKQEGQEEQEARDELQNLDEMFDRPITDYPLSVRTLCCLKDADINTLRELVRLDVSGLLKFRNFGKRSVAELKDFLADHNLMFGMEV